MILKDGHIRPGRVLEVCDNFGTIKACCSGLFSDNDDPKLLPPVYPFHIGNQNHFSKPNVDDEIWVLFFPTNPQELFYWRKDSIKDTLNEVLTDECNDAEVIASLDSGSGYAQIYFTDGTGWIISNDRAIIQIRKDGSILLDQGSKHRKIDINDDNISIGSEGKSAEPAVLGDKLEKTLEQIHDCLQAVGNAAKMSPYTATIGTTIDPYLQKISDAIDKIKSVHVTLD